MLRSGSSRRYPARREVECLFVGEAELFGELMDPDLSCHVRVQPFVVIWCRGGGLPPGRLPAADQSLTFGCQGPNGIRPSSSASCTGALSARANAWRRTASWRQLGDAAHSQAPRPGCARPTTSRPSAVRVTRISSRCVARRRHPTQVRTGSRPGSAVVAGLLQASGGLGSSLVVGHDGDLDGLPRRRRRPPVRRRRRRPTPRR